MAKNSNLLVSTRPGNNRLDVSAPSVQLRTPAAASSSSTRSQPSASSSSNNRLQAFVDTIISNMHNIDLDNIQQRSLTTGIDPVELYKREHLKMVIDLNPQVAQKRKLPENVEDVVEQPSKYLREDINDILFNTLNTIGNIHYIICFLNSVDKHIPYEDHQQTPAQNLRFVGLVLDVVPFVPILGIQHVHIAKQYMFQKTTYEGL